MNPFGADLKRDIQNVTQRVMETFSKEYLRAYKYVLIKDAKKKAKKKQDDSDSSEQGNDKKDRESTWDDPLRPRGNKHKREISPDLKIKIVSWTTLDSDVDPYVAYIVEGTMGERSSSVYRRYNDFKDLNEKLGKKFGDLKKFFPSAKKFEGRKFDTDYLHDRKSKLQKFLDTILENKDLQQDPILIKWCGLVEPEDPQLAEIFDLAFNNTKWRLWIWKRIPYDDEEQAISKLVIEEIAREVYPNVLNGLPNIAQIRSTTMQAVYKVITATVGPAVAVGWKAAKEAVKPIQPKITDVINGALDKLFEVEEEIKRQLVKGISDAMNPLLEQLNPVLKSMAEMGIEPTVSLVKEVYPNFQGLCKIFDSIVVSGDQKLATEIEKFVKDGRMEAEEKVNHIIGKSLEGMLGSLSSQVTLEGLSTFFSPIKRLVDLVNNVFDLFLNPIPHIRCIETLCEYRAKLELLDPTAENFRDQVEEILDEEESWLIWRRWWVYWEYRWKAWSIYYYCWGISELSTVAYVVRDYSFKYAKLQKKWIKHWSFRFGDFVHERAKKATPESWKDTVAECFRIGFFEANKELKHKSAHLFTDLLRMFFYSAVGVKVQDVVMKGISPLLEEAGKAIPSPVDEVLDINSITSDAIEEALKTQIAHTVDECFIDPYQNAFADLSY